MRTRAPALLGNRKKKAESNLTWMVREDEDEKDVFKGHQPFGHGEGSDYTKDHRRRRSRADKGLSEPKGRGGAGTTAAFHVNMLRCRQRREDQGTLAARHVSSLLLKREQKT